MRNKEKWMKPGTKVQLSNNTGIISHTVDARVGENQEVTLKIYVTPDGCYSAQNFNPYDVEPIKAAKSETPGLKREPIEA